MYVLRYTFIDVVNPETMEDIFVHVPAQLVRLVPNKSVLIQKVIFDKSKRKRIQHKKKISLVDSDSESKIIRNYFIMEQNLNRDLRVKIK